MSAYSASAPVTASTIAASAKNAMPKWPTRKPSAYVGDSALRICGCSTMPATPQRADGREPDDHDRPEHPADGRGAAALDQEQPTMITAVIGTTHSSSDGSTTLSPSTADSTEIAGVIMLSPKNSAAPKMPSAASTIDRRRPVRALHRRSSVISAMMPPSPSLSARIASRT